MTFFEQELRRIAKACEDLPDPIFTGRACYADLGGDNRVKLQFVTYGTHEKYEALEATILNRTGGKVDSLLFFFSDVWGSKPVKNSNFRKGVEPHISTYQGKSNWYAYRPTDVDIEELAAEASAYFYVFTERSLTPEKSQVKTDEKESVVKEMRDAKKGSKTRKTSQARKNSEPDL